MSSVTVNINIGGRTYPATVDADKEVYVRGASKQINESIKSFASKFPTTDVQDQLALVLLNSISQQLESDTHRIEEAQKVTDLVDEMTNLLLSK